MFFPLKLFVGYGKQGAQSRFGQPASVNQRRAAVKVLGNPCWRVVVGKPGCPFLFPFLPFLGAGHGGYLLGSKPPSMRL